MALRVFAPICYAGVVASSGGLDGQQEYRLRARSPPVRSALGSDADPDWEPFRTETITGGTEDELPWLDSEPSAKPLDKAPWFNSAQEPSVTVLHGTGQSPKADSHAATVTTALLAEQSTPRPDEVVQATATNIELETQCVGRFQVPRAPLHATDLNGIALPLVCINATGPHHVFTIGDWGGIDVPPMPADRRSKIFQQYHREFVFGADDVAQQNVAAQMALRAQVNPPDYIINVGDNFYWGGVNINCGLPPFQVEDLTGQWAGIFENVYKGPGIDGKQWLGVLGNHDYGGYLFTNGWDQAIAYTWMEGPPSTGRWMTPAQYWRVRVRYPDFSVDYFFVDNNIADSDNVPSSHNMCSVEHNRERASCGPQGPVSIEDCPSWFRRLWKNGAAWLEDGLDTSTADWQIVVIHFPPEHQPEFWNASSRQYGIDLIISGHNHFQLIRHLEPENFLRPTAYIVTGGGGGITSEGKPDATGNDDEYGFMDLTLSKLDITIEAVSHGGHLRNKQHVKPRLPAPQAQEDDTPRYL